MCYAYMSLWYQSSVPKHRGMSNNIVLSWSFKHSLIFKTLEQSSIQQLIVELILGHLVQEEEFINANNTPLETR